jgi:hypothetical protein
MKPFIAVHKLQAADLLNMALWQPWSIKLFSYLDTYSVTSKKEKFVHLHMVDMDTQQFQVMQYCLVQFSDSLHA